MRGIRRESGLLDASVTFYCPDLIGGQGRGQGAGPSRVLSSRGRLVWCRGLIHRCGQRLRARDQGGMTRRTTYGPLCGFNQLFTTRARLSYITVERGWRWGWGWAGVTHPPRTPGNRGSGFDGLTLGPSVSG